MADLINRQDAIDAVRRLPNVGVHWLVSAEAVFDTLLNLPSAQPERDAIQIDWIKDWFADELDLKDFEEFLEPPYDPSVYVQNILEQMFKDWSEEDE